MSKASPRSAIVIPSAALEAGARAVYEVMYPPQSHPSWEYARETMKEIFRGSARVAFLAMIEAWPGAEEHNFDGWTHAAGLVLPLPQEKTDDR